MKRNYFILIMAVLIFSENLQSMEAANPKDLGSDTTEIYDEEDCDNGVLRAKAQRDQGRPKSAYSGIKASASVQSAVVAELFAPGSQAFAKSAFGAQAPAVPDGGRSFCMEAGCALGHRGSLSGELASRPMEKLSTIAEEALASSQSNESPGLLPEDSLDALLKNPASAKLEDK